MRGIEPEQDVPLRSAPPPKHQTDLAASTFVPALAEVNDEGATIRHIAKWSNFGEEQQELLNRFDRWRLVVRKGEADGGTVEVAHEALFRTWKRLESWLEPERARLEALRALQVDSGNWERNGKNEGFLNHRANRLAEARGLSKNAGYAKRLIERDFAYLTACEAAEGLARRRKRRGKVLVACLVGLVALAGVAFIASFMALSDFEPMALVHYRQLIAMGPSVLTAEEEKEKAAKPGPDSAFAECKKGCPVMVVVPKGKFLIGSLENERNRPPMEGPEHEVTIADPFGVSKFEVTFDEWDACVAAAACPKAPDRWGRGQMPAINVSWEDAKQYVRWLSSLTGKEYRLLTEAEREMPHELARRRPIPGAMIPARTTPIATAAAANGMGSKRRPLGRLSRTRSAFTTWLAMSASGLRMFGTIIIKARQRMDRPGSKAAILHAVSSAAVPGATFLRASVRPTAAGPSPTTGSKTLASVWRGRLPLKSLHLYLLGPGRSPLVKFFRGT
jgi:hypothetical protein